VAVGVPSKRELQEALLGRIGGPGRGQAPGGFPPRGRRPGERLGQRQRRLSRRRLAGHDYAYPYLRLGGLIKTNRVRLHKGYVEKYQTRYYMGRRRAMRSPHGRWRIGDVKSRGGLGGPGATMLAVGERPPAFTLPQA